MRVEQFGISETCYRYKPKLRDVKELIADCLLDWAKAKRNWGFELYYLHLLKVHDFK